MYYTEAILSDGTSVKLPMEETRAGARVRLTLRREAVPENFALLRILPELFRAKAGDPGYYILSDPQGCRRTFFRERADSSHTFTASFLPICGKTDGRRAELLIIDGMRHAARIRAEVRGGEYSLAPEVSREETELYEDISVELAELTGADADYSGMARCYREYQLERGACRTLAEKSAERPLLKELAAGPEIRVRMGWKPAPSPVAEQTLENEPPLHTACTFERVGELVDALRRNGVEHAEICLVGWNVRGHDGRYPQLFPVEEAFGGEDGLRRLIKKAQSAGYRIVCHTNSTDAYRIADNWDDSLIITDREGKLLGNARWSGGRAYDLCPVRAKELAEMELPRVRALGFEGAHYIDVISTVPPRNCFSAEHPVNKKQCAEYWNAILARAKELFGGISSEGTYDFTAGELDFGLYSTFYLMKDGPETADDVIPLWQLVYHGITLSNPSAETVNFAVKAPENRLKFYEYGGRPAVYFYSRFVNGTNWMGDDDFLMDTPEQLEDSARRIADMMRDYARVAPLQYCFMERHDKLGDGLYCAEYSDGTRVVVNYRDTAAEADGVSVAPKDFAVLPPRARGESV